MTARATARSISRPVQELLRREPPPPLHVLAVFERTCDLVCPEEQGRKSVVALVTPEIGDGPLNVVLDESSCDFTAVQPGTRARMDGEQLQVGTLEIELADAAVWEPRPNWAALRTRRVVIATHLPVLLAVGLVHDPGGSLLTSLVEERRAPRSREVVLAAVRAGAANLEAGWAGDHAQLRKGAAQLAGLGAGLTPSGDDFLCGAVLWAWLAHPNPGPFCDAIAETAAPQTTTLSSALLWAAAQGACSAGWHRLLQALARGDRTGIHQAAQEVLAHGATSGADALAGFLWGRTGLELG